MQDPTLTEDWLETAAAEVIPPSLLDQEARVIEAKKAIYFSTAEGQGKAQLFQRLQKMLSDLDAEIWLAVHTTKLN